MSAFDDEWSRGDAERQISVVLGAAKTGHVQRVIDVDGTFEIRFVRAKTGPTIADILAEGNPLKKK